MLEPAKICKKALKIFDDADKVKYISKISYWEIALKYSLGKLELQGITPEELLEAANNSGFQTYDINENDIITSYQLPSVESHKDPFDRLIIWQCIKNDLILITDDKKIRQYKQYGLKIL